MRNNPLVLPVLLTVTSIFYSAFRWGSISHSVPVWWNVDASPKLWVPRWVGVPVLIILQLGISYIIYLVVARDTAVDKQAGESKQAVAQLIVLPSLFLFFFYNLLFLESAFVWRDHYFSPRLFVALVAIWLLVWLGYNLQFIEPNKSIGVVTPWTIGSASNWRTTHARAGLTLMGVGVILLIGTSFMSAGIILLIITLLLWLGSYIYVIVFSWDLARVESSSPEPLLSE